MPFCPILVISGWKPLEYLMWTFDATSLIWRASLISLICWHCLASHCDVNLDPKLGKFMKPCGLPVWVSFTAGPPFWLQQPICPINWTHQETSCPGSFLNSPYNCQRMELWFSQHALLLLDSWSWWLECSLKPWLLWLQLPDTNHLICTSSGGVPHPILLQT